MAAVENAVLVGFKQIRNLLKSSFFPKLYPSIYIMGEHISGTVHVGIFFIFR